MARFLLGAIAFCLLAIFANARVQRQVQGQGQGQDFEIHGHVYCDPCRLQFKTNLSYPLDGMHFTISLKSFPCSLFRAFLKPDLIKKPFFWVKFKLDHLRKARKKRYRVRPFLKFV